MLFLEPMRKVAVEVTCLVDAARQLMEWTWLELNPPRTFFLTCVVFDKVKGYRQ